MLNPRAALPAHLQLDADDARLVALWLHGRPAGTQRAYAAATARLRAFLAPLPLAAATLGTLQAFSETLVGSPAYRRRQLAAVKSLLHFAQRVGALRFDVGAALQLPRPPDRAAERVLTEAEVAQILAAVDGRDRAILFLLYASGARVAELVGLTAGACVPDPRGGGAITLHGKRGSRTVRLGPKAWAALDRLRAQKLPQAPVLGVGIERVRQILARAATRAGLQKKPSPHWLRHSHGTHAHRAGASAALIRDTLGHASIGTTDAYLRSSPDDGSGLWLENSDNRCVGAWSPSMWGAPEPDLRKVRRSHDNLP
uniref:Putative Tyrosine recombinase xerD n=1 Tax=mine drainage metagenome TaxID=410659 RepID=E6PJC6_9ZZZZ